MKHSLLLAGLSVALCACTSSSSTKTETTAPQAGKRIPMEWSARNTGTNAQGIPQNRLTLNLTNLTRDELYRTECEGTTLVQGIPDLENSAAYIQCWWAGGGDQYAVFIGDAEQGVIRHRTVDEEAGYGEWEDLKTL